MPHARGIPSALDALLFMFGAVSGFALIAIVSHGGLRGHIEAAGMNVAVWHRTTSVRIVERRQTVRRSRFAREVATP